MQNILHKIKAAPILTLLFFWCVINAIWFMLHGFNIQLEGEKYINQANHFIENGIFTEARHLFYATTIFIIILAKKLTNFVGFAFIVLSLINLLAYLHFFKALVKRWNTPIAALVLCIALLIFHPFQSWISYLYTENLFYSLILFLIAQLVHIDIKQSIKSYSILFFIVLVLLFTRPFGILFLVPIAVFIFIKANTTWRWALIVASIAIVFLMQWVSTIVFTTTPDWTVERSFIEENLICDIPTVANNTNLNILTTGSPFEKLGYYITHNTSHFFGLAAKRLQLFFLNTRTYYSTIHNMALLLILIPIYIVFILKSNSIRKSLGKALYLFICSSILIFSLVVAMQCDDYHNRFFMALFPLFLLSVWIIIKEKLNFS